MSRTTDLIGRTPEEQALADRIGRLFTDPIPADVLAIMTRWDREQSGRVVELLTDPEAPINITEIASLFWRSFAESFLKAALAAATKAAKEPPP